MFILFFSLFLSYLIDEEEKQNPLQGRCIMKTWLKSLMILVCFMTPLGAVYAEDGVFQCKLESSKYDKKTGLFLINEKKLDACMKRNVEVVKATPDNRIHTEVVVKQPNVAVVQSAPLAVNPTIEKMNCIIAHGGMDSKKAAVCFSNLPQAVASLGHNPFGNQSPKEQKKAVVLIGAPVEVAERIVANKLSGKTQEVDVKCDTILPKMNQRGNTLIGNGRPVLLMCVDKAHPQGNPDAVEKAIKVCDDVTGFCVYEFKKCKNLSPAPPEAIVPPPAREVVPPPAHQNEVPPPPTELTPPASVIEEDKCRDDRELWVSLGGNAEHGNVGGYGTTSGAYFPCELMHEMENGVRVEVGPSGRANGWMGNNQGFHYNGGLLVAGPAIKFVDDEGKQDLEFRAEFGGLIEKGHDKEYQMKRGAFVAGPSVAYNNYSREAAGEDWFPEWGIYGSALFAVDGMNGNHSWQGTQIKDTSSLQKFPGIFTGSYRQIIWKNEDVRVYSNLGLFAELPGAFSVSDEVGVSDVEKRYYLSIGPHFDLLNNWHAMPGINISADVTRIIDVDRRNSNIEEMQEAFKAKGIVVKGDGMLKLPLNNKSSVVRVGDPIQKQVDMSDSDLVHSLQTAPMSGGFISLPSMNKQ